jgi:hypothetical protein
MYRWGRRLLRYAGIDDTPVSDARGLYVLPNETAATEFEAAVIRMRRASLVHRVTDADELYRRIGPVWTPSRGQVVFDVPDTSFDEAGLLHRLRQRAFGIRDSKNRSLVVLRQVASPCAVARDSTTGRITVDLGSGPRSAPVVFLAAGAGTVPILDGLGVAHTLRVDGSPLLRLPGTYGMRTSLLVDRAVAISVVAHPPSPSVPQGCLVIGNSAREAIPSANVWSPRIIPPKVATELLNALPEAMRDAATDDVARWTFGYKTEQMGADQTRIVTPWVSGASDNFPPGLIAGIPVKATSALWAASLGLERIHDEMEKLRDQPHTTSPLMATFDDVADLPDWSDIIALHHHADYQHLNDVYV